MNKEKPEKLKPQSQQGIIEKWEDQFDKPYILGLMKPEDKAEFKLWIIGTVAAQTRQKTLKEVVIVINRLIEEDYAGANLALDASKSSLYRLRRLLQSL